MIIYKIISYDLLKKWIIHNNKLIYEIEKIMSEHRDCEQFHIKDFLYENESNKYNSGRAYIIILIKNNTICGIARAEIVINGNVYVSAVNIREKFRGHGLCKIMLRKLINFLQKKSYQIIKLHVESNNIGAIKCYNAIGFNFDSEINDYYYNGSLIKSMSLALS